jgi:kynurenine formamidase
MIITLENGTFVDLDKGHDLSIPLRGDDSNPRAWYVDPPRFEPVRANGWIGSVKEGGDVNFRDIYFNPHGHGTHTECLGHITSEVYSINQHLSRFFFEAQVISVLPEMTNGDAIITLDSLKDLANLDTVEALIIRTLPNPISKCSQNYSDTNPPYLSDECVKLLNRLNVKHLLIDLPSVDKESDGGELLFHHAFWGVPNQPNFERTITELIFVPDEVKDGKYLLNLQVAAFENDAAPSRPVIYSLNNP